MAIDYSRIHRLLKILTLIQGSDGWTAKKLAAECGVVIRTIYRDLDMLEGAGIPYFFDEEKKCYSVRRDFFMPPVQMTLEESLALVALGEHIAGQEQVPFTKAASRAVDKIRGLLPASIRDDVEKVVKHVAIKLSPVNPPEGMQDVYEIVRSSIASKKLLKCTYESIGGKQGDGHFLLKPYTLFFCQRAWYVIGHRSDRNEVRCLKLNRFTDIKLTPTTYVIPKSFSLQNHLGNAWRMIRGKKRHEIILKFDKEFADTISDTHWHATQEIEWLEDGSIIFKCTVDGLEEIVWWILSMGPHCKVQKPKELADQVCSLGKCMIEMYSQSES